jgi:hypothetical protein
MHNVECEIPKLNNHINILNVQLTNLSKSIKMVSIKGIKKR